MTIHEVLFGCTWVWHVAIKYLSHGMHAYVQEYKKIHFHNNIGMTSVGKFQWL